jgi:uncharacterized peroxidase-related enzyme
MSRLNTIKVTEATGETAQLFAGIKQAVGKVPNLYATIGTNAPGVLAHVLGTSALLKKSSLVAREQEAINLAVSEATGCDYCLAAHTLFAKAAGYSVEQTRKLRAGAYDEDDSIDALVKFAVQVVTTRGTLPAESVEALRAAGYDDTQVIEALAVVNAILFTNMVNRVNDTTLDFPKAP